MTTVIAFNRLPSVRRPRVHGVEKTQVVTRESAGDGVRFGAGYPLTQKYGLSVSQIPVVAPTGVQLSNKAELVEKVLEAHEAAKKWQRLGNFSNRYIGTSLELANGTWATGVNIELSRDCTLCAERSVLVSAQCKALENTPLERLEANTPDASGKSFVQAWWEGVQVKTLVVTSETLGKTPGICSDCESWMTSARYFTPDTQLAWLEKDKATDALTLKVQPLSQRLPFWGKGQPSMTQKTIETLPVQVSEEARKVMESRGWDEMGMKNLLIQAKSQFENAPHAIFTDKNLACAMAFESGPLQLSSRVDITKRWFVPGDLSAFSAGVQTRPGALQTWISTVLQWIENPWASLKALVESWWEKLQNWFATGKFESAPKANRIQAIAYYGTDSDVPPMATTGYFAQPTRGGMDTLLAVIENDTVQVRTIRDYRPYTYISDFQQPVSR